MSLNSWQIKTVYKKEKKKTRTNSVDDDDELFDRVKKKILRNFFFSFCSLQVEERISKLKYIFFFFFYRHYYLEYCMFENEIFIYLFMCLSIVKTVIGTFVMQTKHVQQFQS